MESLMVNNVQVRNSQLELKKDVIDDILKHESKCFSSSV